VICIISVRIKYESCWDVLDDLKVDKSKVFVILTKFDSVINSEQMKSDIANYLKISNPLFISSKTGYGIHSAFYLTPLQLQVGISTHKQDLKNDY
jgi:50S ribosomal subunit-associated GTPase HflX